MFSAAANDTKLMFASRKIKRSKMDIHLEYTDYDFCVKYSILY